MSTAVTAPGRDNLSLYQIEADLQELMVCLEEAENEATREAVEQGIREYLEREVRKVDGVRAYLKHCEVMAAAATAEMRVQAQRAAAWTARAKKLIDGCKSSMESFGVKRLEGNTGTLVLKGNGGVQPLEIADESLVPDEYCRAVVELPYRDWLYMVECAGPEVSIPKPKRLVDNSSVRKAITEPCWACEGRCSTDSPCSLCGNTGLAGVPGAQLGPRGTHLEVK